MILLWINSGQEDIWIIITAIIFLFASSSIMMLIFVGAQKYKLYSTESGRKVIGFVKYIQEMGRYSKGLEPYTPALKT